MFKQLKTKCVLYWTAFLSLFKKNKKPAAILSDVGLNPPTVQTPRVVHSVAVGRFQNIAYAIDQECVELYGRSPHVK